MYNHVYIPIEDNNEEMVNVLDNSLLHDKSLNDYHGGPSVNKVGS